MDHILHKHASNLLHQTFKAVKRCICHLIEFHPPCDKCVVNHESYQKWFIVKPHTSGIRMTYEYTRVTYGWHTSKYEWHTSTHERHTDDIRVHTSDIRMTYEYIRMTCEYTRVTHWWHTNTYEWHTDDIRVHRNDIQVHMSDIRMTWHTNDIRVTYGWCMQLTGINFWCIFSAWFFHINAPYLILYQLRKFQRHIFFTGYQTKCVIKFLFRQLMTS